MPRPPVAAVPQATPATQAHADAALGVTAVVRRRVRPEAIAEFEDWLEGILAATSKFEGHLGANIVRPAAGGDQDYVIIFRFDTAAHLAHWDASSERAEWLARAEAFTIGSAQTQRITGLEYWFTLPNHAASQPPPAWKMALVTLVGLFPLVLLVAPRLRAWMASLPRPVDALFTVAILVALMTWLVMPTLVRLARPWLFPSGPPTCDGNGQAPRRRPGRGGSC